MSDEFPPFSPLSLKPVEKKHKKKRHRSVPNVVKSGIFPETKNNDEDVSPTFNVSAFSKDPIQFASELKSMIQSIRNENKLPSTKITVTLLYALDFWIINHGITAIDKLNEIVEKYDCIQLEFEKERRNFEGTIEEYKKEYNRVQQAKESINNSYIELTTKLSDDERKLANARFLQLQIVTLREELDRKSAEYDKTVKQRTIQQKQMSSLTKENKQLQDIIESQLKLSKTNHIDNELKNKMNEMNKKYKDIELKLDKMSLEKEELFEENKSLKRKLIHYGKLKANLAEYEKKDAMHSYLHRMNTMKAAGSYSASSLDDLELESDAGSSLHDELENLHDSTSDVSFVEFNDDVHTYNINEEENECEAMEPKFDENELKEFKEFEEFDIGDNNNESKAGDNWFTYRAMYRSFAIVGVLCLCYFLYVKYYKRGSWKKAKQIHDKYKTLQNSLNGMMKKGVVQKLSLRN